MTDDQYAQGIDDFWQVARVKAQRTTLGGVLGETPAGAVAPRGGATIRHHDDGDVRPPDARPAEGRRRRGGEGPQRARSAFCGKSGRHS